jgi:hypothetical protein
MSSERLTKTLENWEGQFVRKYGRTPTNDDIKAHPKVLDKYLLLKQLITQDAKLIPSSVELPRNELKVSEFKVPTPIKPKRHQICFASPRKLPSTIIEEKTPQKWKGSCPIFSDGSRYKDQDFLSGNISSSFGHSDLQLDTQMDKESHFPQTPNPSDSILTTPKTAKNKMTLWMQEDETIDPTPQKAGGKINFFTALKQAHQNEKKQSSLADKFLEASIEIHKPALKRLKRNSIPQFFTDQQNSQRFMRFTQTASFSESKSSDVILKLSPTKTDGLFGSMFDKTVEDLSSSTVGVYIEEENSPDISANLIVKSMLPISSKNSLKPSDLKPMDSIMCHAPIRKNTKPVRRINSTDNILKLNKFLPTTRSFRRASSLCNIKEVPTDFKEFLTEEQVKLFADVIQDTTGQNVTEDDNHIASCHGEELDRNESIIPEKKISINEVVENMKSPDEDPIINVKIKKSLKLTSKACSSPLSETGGCEQLYVEPDRYTTLVAKRASRKARVCLKKDESEDDSDLSEFQDEEDENENDDKNKNQCVILKKKVAAPRKAKAAVKSVKKSSLLPKNEETSGWNSKTVSKKSKKTYGNFRKLKLKGISRQGKSGGHRMGSSKFHTVK